MNIHELSKTILLILSLLLAVNFYNFILKKFVKEISHHKVLFAAGVFLFFSVLYAFEKDITALVSGNDAQRFIKIVLECLWWFSLFFIANQIIHIFIWKRLLRQSGILIPKIFKDLVSLFFLIITVAAIVHFVFEKSVFGIFTASGVMAIILGYSAQATLSDVFAGIGLNTTKQFSEGDWIIVYGEMQTLTGKVIDVNWRFVNLLNVEGNLLSIPNSVISQLFIENLSQPHAVNRQSLTITISQAISPYRFKRILIETALQSCKVHNEPEPCATLMECGQETSTYHLEYTTAEINPLFLKDEIYSVLWYRCLRENILLTGQVIAEKPILTADEISQFLQQIDLFHSLNGEEIQFLVEHCHYGLYGPPERLLIEGGHNDSLFLVYSGSASLYINSQTEKPLLFESYEAGNYFGEISMLTGAACRGSLFMETECLIIEITHDTIGKLFAARPELMEKMSTVVVKGVKAIENLRHAQIPVEGTDRHSLLQSLLAHVRYFFRS
ncbi:sulfate permease with a cNMP binding motif protein [Legionella birminghamensis]|uniref:Sulfate permease with a cNMP binding motif n=1 Tax=Legionella birminghamensis TaxID=28083 RepID=A0A378IAI3_9GAMM|nr:mechanosensitive ion channel family protein [Legionella birminghamensis]KTC67789.1 sulfate permease with a cNMP binding motif protein [Legionella birminghamensis]STX32053.1 sulfate permease with a cNMP binding motif [Legionella birminghamensis]